jgi:hypothetical protein
MSQVQDRFLSEEYQASTGRLVRETQVGGEKKKSHAGAGGKERCIEESATEQKPFR